MNEFAILREAQRVMRLRQIEAGDARFEDERLRIVARMKVLADELILAGKD